MLYTHWGLWVTVLFHLCVFSEQNHDATTHANNNQMPFPATVTTMANGQKTNGVNGFGNTEPLELTRGGEQHPQQQQQQYHHHHHQPQQGQQISDSYRQSPNNPNEQIYHNRRNFQGVPNTQQSDNIIPIRFIRAAKGDPVLAQSRYEETLTWRRNERMDAILSEPHPYFDTIKRHYRHYYHLRGMNNEPVYYEYPAKMNLKALKDAGVTMDGLMRHYALVCEFMWRYIEPSEEGKSIYVIDLDGIRLLDFAGEVVSFVRKATAFTSRHYPERAGCVFVVNVPSWFSMIWNVVRPLLDETTLKKIEILRGEDEIRAALRRRIPLENIPPEYGGLSMPLGYSPEEKMLFDVMYRNNYYGYGGHDQTRADSYGETRYCDNNQPHLNAGQRNNNYEC